MDNFGDEHTGIWKLCDKSPGLRTVNNECQIHRRISHLA